MGLEKTYGLSLVFLGAHASMDLFEDDHWQGMPEFIQNKKEPYKTLIVRFDSESDYTDFQNLIGQKLTVKTKSIWHPFKSHWGLQRMVYKHAD